MSGKQGPNPYLRNQVLTAGPEQLRLMLYDGAIRFCRLGRSGIETRDYEGSYTNFSKAQKIVLELGNSLDHSQSPELCDRLSSLYTYVYRLLVEGCTQRETPPIDEAVKLLEYERETWRMLMEGRGNDAETSPPAAPASKPDPYGSNVPRSSLTSYAA